MFCPAGDKLDFKPSSVVRTVKFLVRNQVPTKEPDYYLPTSTKAKMGEVLANIPKKGEHLTSQGGRKATLPNDISHKQSHEAQELSRKASILCPYCAVTCGNYCISM